MLQNLSERVRRCYERAAEAREHAEATSEPEAKADFLKMERRWLLLARSHELGERVDDFLRAKRAPQVVRAFDPHSMLQASGAAIFAKDSESRMMFANPACLRLVGKSWSELSGRNDVQWHSDRVQARNVLANDRDVVGGAQVRVFEEPFDTPLGTRIILNTKAPLFDDEAKVAGIVGIAKDITERKKREEHAELLHEELRHRLKNCLALVQAMARQTLKGSDGLSDFEARLAAYGRSHDVIERSDGASLHALVGTHARSLSAANRLHVDGPEVFVSAKFAFDLGIALHELMTNSVKYGALGGDGRIDLGWHIEVDNERRHLVVSWHEQHGRLQLRPARQGFGHRVLTETIPKHLNGMASHEIAPGLVRWQLRAELEPTRT